MTKKMIYFNDVYLCTESFGESNHPTILLIMGSTLSMNWWEDDFCKRLSNQGFHVIRYDHRDVGRSINYKYGSPAYSIEDLADDAIQILDAYKIEEAHIVGMSMGGIITQILALKYPERVLTISLVMTSNYDSGLPKMDSKVIESFSNLSINDWENKEEVLDYIISRSELLAGTRHPFNKEKIRSLAEADFDSANNLRCMENHRLISGGESYLFRTDEIDKPSLIIHGTEDPLIPYEHGVHLSTVIQNAILVTLEGTGHELHIYDWDKIIHAISKHATINSSK